MAVEDTRTACLLLRAVDCDSVSVLRMDLGSTTGVMTTWSGPAIPDVRLVRIGEALSSAMGEAARRSTAMSVHWPEPSVDDRHDLVIPLHADDGRLISWLLTRLDRSFQADDVQHATLLAPGLLRRLDRPFRTAPSGRTLALTARETDVLKLVGLGLTAAAVGRRLAISERTVQKHLERVYGKLGCTDRLTAVLRARAAALI